MRPIWINTTGIVVIASLISGCATDAQKLLTHNDATMLDIWQQETGAGASNAIARLADARQGLRRPVMDPAMHAAMQLNAAYTRTAQTEIERQFHRLPNPDLVMYVFPHVTGTVPVPVPGYSTVFSFYQRVQYALPGERIEDF